MVRLQWAEPVRYWIFRLGDCTSQRRVKRRKAFSERRSGQLPPVGFEPTGPISQAETDKPVAATAEHPLARLIDVYKCEAASGYFPSCKITINTNSRAVIAGGGGSSSVFFFFFRASLSFGGGGAFLTM